MAEFIRYCLLLLLMTRLPSGVTGINSKHGCIGDYIELYKNISFNTPNIVVSLFKNGEHNVMIVMWTMVNSVFNETFNNGYGEKMFLDKHGNILIRNLNVHDEGRYVLQTIKGSSTTKNEVQLIVLAAPDTHCRPTIIRSENTLIASLTMADCGKPAVSLYWLEHSGISYGKNVIKLQSRNKGGTYHACIEGPALTCARSTKLSDFCEVFRVDEDEIGSPVSEMPDATLATIILISVLIVIIIAASIILFLCMSKMQKRIAKSGHQEDKEQLFLEERTGLVSSVDMLDVSTSQVEQGREALLPSNVGQGVSMSQFKQKASSLPPSNAGKDKEKNHLSLRHIKKGPINLSSTDIKPSPSDVTKVKSMNDCNEERKQESHNTAQTSNESPDTGKTQH